MAFILLILLIAVATAQAQPATLTDSRDGKTYKTVKIGNQIWMAENLNYDASSSVCYENKPANCATYGRLYNWETANKACPSGWHLPSNSEWEELGKAVGGEKIAGKKLKAKSDWNENGNGMDEFGFAALPGGYGSSDVDFNDVGYNSYWWDASENSATNAYYHSMGYYHKYANWNNLDKSYLFSVRCIKDYP